MNSKIKAVSKIARNSLQIDLIKSLIMETQKIKNDIEKYNGFIFLNFFNEEQVLKYEKFMNLEPDLNLSLQDRRDRILYRLLSKQIFSPANLKEQARIFTNGEVEITEVFNEYYFIIRFTSIYGVPPNLKNFILLLCGTALTTNLTIKMMPKAEISRVNTLIYTCFCLLTIKISKQIKIS